MQNPDEPSKEVKEILDREGRDAKNLLVYQICSQDDGDETPSTSRKPPPSPKSPNSLAANTPKPNISHSPGPSMMQGAIKKTSCPRVRSASTGRDKRSELQARYWALLFGNLQRAVNEIYQTVECYENISSCQEAILVLENYVRDFKALSEWFKVSWDYEATPLPQRPQSLAWEVRKSNPTRRVRAKSLSSPTQATSGMSSPTCFSGHCSPCCNMDTLSPRKMRCTRAFEAGPRAAMRVNVSELFSSSKRQTAGNEALSEVEGASCSITPAEMPAEDTREVVNQTHQYAQTDLDDENLTLAEVREKLRLQEEWPAISDHHMPSAHGSNETLTQLRREKCTLVCASTSQKPKTKKVAATQNEALSKNAPREAAAVKPRTMQKKVEVPEALAKPAKAIPVVILPQQVSDPKAIKPVANVNHAGVAVVTAQTGDNAMKKPIAAVAAPNNMPLKYSSVLNRVPVQTKAVAKGNPQKTAAAAATHGKPNDKSQAVPKSVSQTGMRRAANNSAPPKAFKGQPSQMNPRNMRMNSQNPLSARLPHKPELYGPPMNIANRMNARSSTMIDMSSNGSKKTSAPNSSRNPQPRGNSSRKASRDDVCSSNSTLKASSEGVEVARCNVASLNGDAADERRSEPKQMQSDAQNDGWLMVKNRRRSSLHWANRYDQPTGYASLPTLMLLNAEKREDEQHREPEVTPRVETNRAEKPLSAEKPEKQPPTPRQKQAEEKPSKRPEVKNAKAKVNSLPQTRKQQVNAQSKQQVASVPSRETIMKRQKSDLTGLKMTSLHKEYMRSEKNAKQKRTAAGGECETEIEIKTNSNVDDNSSADTVVEVDQLHISLGTSSTDSDSVEQHKIDIKIQTNRDFSKTIGDLYDSISQSAKRIDAAQQESGGEAAAVLSSCDENDETLAREIECDEDQQRMLVEEQESLERQIRELESTEIDVDTETDETDCEANAVGRLNDDDDQDDNCASSILFVTDDEVENSSMSLELRYGALLSEMSWGEREEALATLRTYVSRHPGRAQELHQKLSSPSRRRSLQETLKKYQAKQARAQQKRELLQKEKAIKIQQLLARVEDVISAKQQLIESKRLKMEGRLQRAAENRSQFLKQIIEKAHDEDKKLKEINFIKSIEAQNKRLDLIESFKETEVRLQDLEQERQKRLEEKAAKEAAVERRRQELEKERQRKLEKMNETRLEKEQRIGKMQEQKERQRQAMAREKARDREERLLALQAQQQQTTEELQRKILQKQMESARRHEENIEHIRQRALELAVPTRNQDEPERDPEGAGDGEEGAVGGEDGDMSSTVSDVGSREHKRSYKKKMKKLKQRMMHCAEEYLKELQPLPFHTKRESHVPKFLNHVWKGGGSLGVERPLGQLFRLISKAQIADFQCFLLLDGLGTISSTVFKPWLQDRPDVTKKSMVLAVQLYRNACTLCPQITRHAVLGNTVVDLFDALFRSLQLPEEKSPQYPVELSTELMLACTVALGSPSFNKKVSHTKVQERLPDVVSYTVATGLVELLARRCMKIRESIEFNQSVVLSILATLGILTRLIDVCPSGPADPTRFLHTARSTELFGTVSMLYASVVPIGGCIPPKTTSLAAATFNLLVSIAVMDLSTYQDVLSGEVLAFKYLDVITVLLKYCAFAEVSTKYGETQAVVIDLVASIGFFCANNRKNQDLLISEQWSVVIKTLTKLPSHFDIVVYPCLVTLTYHNTEARNAISREFNIKRLDEYCKSERAQHNHLVGLLK